MTSTRRAVGRRNRARATTAVERRELQPAPPVSLRGRAVSRRQALGLLAGSCACALCGGAHARSLNYELVAAEIAPKTWAVHGRNEYFSMQNGGNIVNVGFVETPDGIVVIDTGPSLRFGNSLNALIRQMIPGKPILRVYNTHHHPDHFLGNQAFDKSVIAAPQKVIDNIVAEGDALTDNMYRLIGDWMRGTAPQVPTIALDAQQEDIGGRRFSLFYLSGHTSADFVIRDDATGVLFTGDLAFMDRAPTTPHADLPQWREALRTLAGTDSELILPGHGPSDTGQQSLVQTYDYLNWLDDVLRDAVARGWSMNEAMQIAIPGDFRHLDVVDTEFERSVVHLYQGLEDELLPPVPLQQD